MDTVIEIEFRELCRICANPQGQDIMIPIFEKEGIKMNLLQKINCYLPITVYKDDGFPDQVCISCTSKLNVCELLIQTCSDADARLQALKKQLDIEAAEFLLPKQEACDFVECEKINEQCFTQISSEKPIVSIMQGTSVPGISSLSQKVHKVNIVVVNVPKDELLGKDDIALRESEDSDVEGTNEVLEKNIDDNQLRQVIAEAEQMQMQAAENFLRALEENLDEPCNIRNDSTNKEAPVHSKLKVYHIPNLPNQPGLDEERLMPGNKGSSENIVTKKCGSEVRRSQRRRTKNKFFDSDTEITTSSCSYECKLCKKVFFSASGLRIHNKKKTHKFQLERLLCLTCNTKFEDVNAAEEHECNYINKFNCEFCNLKFSSVQESELHKLRHSSGPFTCAICNDQFHNLMVLQNHIIQHTRDNRPYQCNLCGKMFKSKIGLHGHQERHTNSRTYLCYICQMPFSNREDMLAHRVAHSKQEKDIVHARKIKLAVNIKRFPCEICGKSLSSKAGLTVHLRMHKGEKPFECDQCGHRFRQAIKLKYHQRLHAGDLPYVCTLCEKRFNTQRQMDTHLRVHTNERPYICEICGVRFRSNGVLGRHRNTHSEEPLYSCSFCGKRFRTRHATTVHERTHTGEKRFMCDLCGRSFAQKTSLEKHRFRHEKQRVECLECNTTFASRKGLRRHFEKKHTPVIVESIHMLDGASPEFVSVPMDDLVVEVVV